MTHTAFYLTDPDGMVVCSGSMPTDQIEQQEIPAGLTRHIGVARVGMQQVVDGELRDYVRPLHYTEARIRSYPSIGDQLDALWKWAASLNADVLNPQAAEMLAAIAKVKTEYPKESQ